MAVNANLGIRDTVTLSFSDSERGIDFGQLEIDSNDSLRDIVNKINNDPNLNQNLRAALIPNGNGYVLRIEDVGGAQLEITELNNPQTGLLDTLGLQPSNAGISTTIGVREDITVAPELIANGSPIFNDNTGKYELNQAANDIANAMAKVLRNRRRLNNPEPSAKPSRPLPTMRRHLSAISLRPPIMRLPSWSISRP